MAIKLGHYLSAGWFAPRIGSMLILGFGPGSWPRKAGRLSESRSHAGSGDGSDYSPQLPAQGSGQDRKFFRAGGGKDARSGPQRPPQRPALWSRAGASVARPAAVPGAGSAGACAPGILRTARIVFRRAERLCNRSRLQPRRRSR